jgi:hypothetical protein
MARRLISRGSLAARLPADAGTTGVLLGAAVGAGLGLEALGSVFAATGVGAGAVTLAACAGAA